MKIWYNEIKEFYMQKFIQAYIEKLDVTTIIEYSNQGHFSFTAFDCILYC